jgi:hypothetical protein
VKFLLICEGEGDDEDLKALTVRVLQEEHLWLVGLDRLEEPLPSWLEYEPGRGFLRWSDIDKACDARKVPRVQRLGRGLGYRAALRAFRLLSALPALELRDGLRVVMVHDSDRVDGWQESLELARTDWLGAMRGDGVDADVALGIAHPEHEAWVLVAFEPRDTQEKGRLEELRRRLGFDPTTQGDRLTSGRETSPKDAKKTLRELCPDADRRRALMREAPLQRLRSCGGSTGLSAFLDELRLYAASAFRRSPGGG